MNRVFDEGYKTGETCQIFYHFLVVLILVFQDGIVFNRAVYPLNHALVLGIKGAGQLDDVR